MGEFLSGIPVKLHFFETFPDLITRAFFYFIEDFEAFEG